MLSCFYTAVLLFYLGCLQINTQIMHLKCSTHKWVRSRSRVTETRLIRLYNNLINTVKYFINYKNVVYQNIILGATHYEPNKKIPPKPCEPEQLNLIAHVTQSNQIKIGL